MTKVTVLLIDDHQMLIDAWADLLNSDGRFLVIGRTGNAEEAYTLVRKQHPSVVLTDINMVPVDGFTITRTICGLSKVSKVIGVSLYNMPGHAKRMMQAGAWGYVTKNSPIEELKIAILQISNGHKYLCDEIKGVIATERLLLSGSPTARKLTDKEMGIIQLIKQGLSSREIGESLGISFKTVEVHRYNILKKLDLKNTAALVNFIHQQGY